MTFYHKRGRDDIPLIRKKTIVKTFAVFFCVIGGYLFVRTNYTNCINTTGILNSSQSVDEDWFDGNITNFQNKADAYNYIVLRKTAIERYGDFSCQSSTKTGMCAFKVETLIEALQICNAYADVCTGFVLTRDMNIRLKHQVRQLSYDNQAVTFLKIAFLSRIGHSVTEAPELYGRMASSRKS